MLSPISPPSGSGLFTALHFLFSIFSVSILIQSTLKWEWKDCCVTHFAVKLKWNKTWDEIRLATAAEFINLQQSRINDNRAARKNIKGNLRGLAWHFITQHSFVLFYSHIWTPDPDALSSSLTARLTFIAFDLRLEAEAGNHKAIFNNEILYIFHLKYIFLSSLTQALTSSLNVCLL